MRGTPAPGMSWRGWKTGEAGLQHRQEGDEEGEGREGRNPRGRAGETQHFEHQHWSSINEYQERQTVNIESTEKLAAGLKAVTRTT